MGIIMKFFALIALFGVAQSLTLTQLSLGHDGEEEKKAAAPDAAAAPAKPVEGAPAKPAEGAPKKAEKPAAEEKDVGKLGDANADAAKAATEATANASDAAVDAGMKKAEAKAGPPRERTASEKTRDHVLNVAKVGQEAIESNESNNKEIADRYAAQDKVWEAAQADGTSGNARAASA